MPFTFTRLRIPEIILVTPTYFADERGAFVETYKYSEFLRGGITEQFVQDNQSLSKRNVIRGLHFQKQPQAQGKLVRCLKGKIFDVAVDLRKSSPTYATWVGFELSSENSAMLYIPPAFAHGFVALSEDAVVSYKCTKEYSKELDTGICWNDPTINIRWPGEDFIVSRKDRHLPLLNDSDANF